MDLAVLRGLVAAAGLGQGWRIYKLLNKYDIFQYLTLGSILTYNEFHGKGQQTAVQVDDALLLKLEHAAQAQAAHGNGVCNLKGVGSNGVHGKDSTEVESVHVV